MFESKYIIEGKIFIHHRRDALLTVFHRYELPAIYFECFMNAQNFNGHFVEVHAEPSDWVRAIYIEKHGKNKIIAFYNLTQQVIHLHPREMIFGHWSMLHRVLPIFIQIFATSLILLFLLFSFVRPPAEPIQFLHILYDAVKFSLSGIGLFVIGFVLPFVFPCFLFRRSQTLDLLHLLNLSNEQILAMEKRAPQSRIYTLQHLQPQKMTTISNIKTYK